MYYPDFSEFEGTFIGNKKDGVGIKTDRACRRIEETWRYGRLMATNYIGNDDNEPNKNNDESPFDINFNPNNGLNKEENDLAGFNSFSKNNKHINNFKSLGEIALLERDLDHSN